MTRGELETELECLHPDCFGWAMVCCDRNTAQAEDVLQNVYLKVLDGRAQFSGQSSFRTWLFGVIRTTAMQQRRKWAVRNRLLKLMFFMQDKTENATPEASEMYSHRSHGLLAAMEYLSKRQREVIQLVFYHDMSIEKAAEILGVSTGSARTHYARGKRNLATRLREWDDE